MTNTLFRLNFAVERTSEIVVGSVAETLQTLLPKGRVVAIVDSEVDALTGISEMLPESVLIPGGEENKNLQLAEMLWQELVDSKVDRDTFLLGVGGGVVTDLVGFVASTYMRGVRFGLVPTTLMGQVDAAIGGKCAINLGGYKNMVGSFASADFVLCDSSLLATLPEKEFRAGVAEVIKTAVVGDKELFAILERASLEELRVGGAVLQEVVRRCVAVKCGIVARDPYESNERRVLNLGHTMAHAIESLTSEYAHGEAVAVGLVWAAKVAVERGILPAEDAERIERVVKKYGLPTVVHLAEEELEEAMTHDKKSREGRVKIILPTRIGECVITDK